MLKVRNIYSNSAESAFCGIAGTVCVISTILCYLWKWSFLSVGQTPVHLLCEFVEYAAIPWAVRTYIEIAQLLLYFGRKRSR